MAGMRKRGASHRRSRRRRPFAMRPRCDCRKAIYESKARAQVAVDRWGLARVYVCRFNHVHTTSLPSWDPRWSRLVEGGAQPA